MKKILVVEDDVNIQDIVAFNLETAGYQVFTADNGVEAIEILKDEEDISLVIMDIMMPKMDGYECTEKIREFSDIPIILLTALESESDKLKGFELDINDYVVKPFSIKELVARVNNQLRLSEQKGNVNNKNKKILHINNIVFDLVEGTVKVGDRVEVLTNKEYSLLMFLYQNPNKIFNRDELLKAIWTKEIEDARAVDVAVKRIREKIEVDSSNPQNLKTRRGKGYYLNLKDSEEK